MSRGVRRYQYVKEYSSFESDIDLVADGPDGKPAARIVMQSTGAIALSMLRKGNTVLTSVLTGFADGEDVEVDVYKILATGTTITKCHVYWE